MWAVIQYVTSGLTLAAFIVAVVSFTIRAGLKNKRLMIETTLPQDRTRLVEQTLEQYHIETATLTKEQKYNIIMEQLQSRSKRQRQYFRLGTVAFVILSFVAFYAIRVRANPTLNEVTITGVIQDSAGNAISGVLVTVEAHDFASETRSTGAFRGTLYNIKKGESILINVMHDDYMPEPINVTISDSSVELHTIRLRKTKR